MSERLCELTIVTYREVSDRYVVVVVSLFVVVVVVVVVRMNQRKMKSIHYPRCRKRERGTFVSSLLQIRCCTFFLPSVLFISLALLGWGSMKQFDVHSSSCLNWIDQDGTAIK